MGDVLTKEVGFLFGGLRGVCVCVCGFGWGFFFSLFGVSLLPLKAQHIWDVTLCGKCSIQLQYKQSFSLHILKL